MKTKIIVLILINLLVCGYIDSHLKVFDEKENNFERIPSHHYNKNRDDEDMYERNVGKDQYNLYTNNLSPDYRGSRYQYTSDDWMNGRTMNARKNQESIIKRNIRNKSTNISSLNEKDLSNTFINNTLNDAKTAEIPNLLSSVTNNNGTNEFEDLREILNQIYEELEIIKTAKMCTEKDPDGNDCDFSGVWNSAEIGLRIELSTSPDIDGNKLHVNLGDKISKKPAYRIDATWKCSGSAVHKNGGPFYFHCTNHQSPQSMTIFHGICKKCSGFDTIFGEWIFQHVPSDCRQLWTFSETRRDVFHKNIIHHSKISSIGNASNNQSISYSSSKNNDTVKSKTEKYRRNIKFLNKFTQKINQDLLYENPELN